MDLVLLFFILGSFIYTILDISFHFYNYWVIIAFAITMLVISFLQESFTKVFFKKDFFLILQLLFIIYVEIYGLSRITCYDQEGIWRYSYMYNSNLGTGPATFYYYFA